MTIPTALTIHGKGAPDAPAHHGKARRTMTTPTGPDHPRGGARR